MDIHQMQIKYDALADRLLWQVRTRTGELYAVWLTRRMVGRLWPPFLVLVTRGGIAQVAPNATPVPDARAMLEQAARERPLPAADFKAQFDAKAVSRPLGAEPLLPTAIDLTADPKGPGLTMNLREEGGRNLRLHLDADLATALLRLLQQALKGADWGAAPVTAVPPENLAPTPPAALN
jgi:hypothetical protein